MKNQAISATSLKLALSEERLSSYYTSDDSDVRDAVARYIWNLALGCAMQPALHALEITFRNHLFRASQKIVKGTTLSYRDVECWLDADPSLLEANEQVSVEDAKETLRQEKKELTSGRLISKLSFGFWVSLCKRPYEQGRGSGPALWPKLLVNGFPFLAEKPKRTRSDIYHRMDDIRRFRNRVSHHEAIWEEDLRYVHRRVLDTLGWMNTGLASTLRTVSLLDKIIDNGPGFFRATAMSIVKPDKGK
jgi:hypothetical protein